MSITANFRSITLGYERNTIHCFKFSPGNLVLCMTTETEHYNIANVNNVKSSVSLTIILMSSL